MSDSVTPRRDWKDNLRDGTIVHATTPWSRWPGVQLMHMSHSMREFEMFSNVHAILMNAGSPARYELRNSLGLRSVDLPPQPPVSATPAVHTGRGTVDLRGQGSIRLIIQPHSSIKANSAMTGKWSLGQRSSTLSITSRAETTRQEASTQT